MVGITVALVCIVVIQFIVNLILFDETKCLNERIGYIEKETYSQVGFFATRNIYHERINELEERIENLPQVKAEKKLERLKEIEEEIKNLQEEE